MLRHRGAFSCSGGESWELKIKALKVRIKVALSFCSLYSSAFFRVPDYSLLCMCSVWHRVFSRENVCSSCRWLWGSVWGVSLQTTVFLLFLLLCITSPWWFGVAKKADTDVAKPFLRSSAVPFNFATVVLVIP